MNGNSGVLVGISPTLGGNSVDLVGRIPCINVAVLEHNGSISENEIYSSIDVTLPVKLPVGVDIKSILVPFKAALVKH